jgi:hypothetical protein
MFNQLVTNRKIILAILVLAIIAVVLRDLYDVHQCIDTGGTWNPKKKVCEVNIPTKK